MKLTYWSFFPAFSFVAYHLYIGFFYTLFPRFNSNGANFSSLLLCCIFILAIVQGLLQWYKSKDKLMRSTEQEKVTRNVLTGLAGIALSGIIPRLLSIIFGADGQTMYNYFKLFNCSYLIFFIVFCSDFPKYVELKFENYQKHLQAIGFIITAHILGLIFAIRKEFAGEESNEVYIFHYYFTLVFMASSIEFYVYWKDGVHVKDPEIRTIDGVSGEKYLTNED
ncbi:hypothetical protein CAEBREN_16285 [Caenorhabditis brenneri]|uniref:Uncharacterized protein n=1 Tax=Caenorhabditis brenneri TaxID=135651 RepID=G0MWM9_CAEBE|nr:hypothetical protein CAEBREN_16285 [Caenorhabditis brenneri]